MQLHLVSILIVNILLQSFVSTLATGIQADINVGSQIDFNDKKEANHFRDSLATNIGGSDVQADSVGRQINFDALPILPFQNDLGISADAGYQLQTFKVQKDLGGNFVNYGGVRLYLNIFGEPMEYSFEAGIPTISLPYPRYFGF